MFCENCGNQMLGENNICIHCKEKQKVDFSSEGGAKKQIYAPLLDPPPVRAERELHLAQGGCAIAVGIVGVILFFSGLFRFNSIESQFIRGMGGSDPLSIALMVFGGVAMLAGFLSAFHTLTSSTPAETNIGHIPQSRAGLMQRFCTECGARSEANDCFCSECGKRLDER